MGLVPGIAVESLIRTGVKSEGSYDFCNMQAKKIIKGNQIVCLCCFSHLILENFRAVDSSGIVFSVWWVVLLVVLCFLLLFFFFFCFFGGG